MGLKKILNTATGVDAEHWALTYITGKWTVDGGTIKGTARVVISGWTNKQARLDGFDPIGVMEKTFDDGASGLLADFVHGKLKDFSEWSDAIDD